MYPDRLTEVARCAFASASGIARANGSNVVEPIHLLAALGSLAVSRSSSGLNELFEACSARADQIQAHVHVLCSKTAAVPDTTLLPPSSGLEEVFNQLRHLFKQRNTLHCSHLLTALLSSGGEPGRILTEVGFTDIDKAVSAIT